MRNKVLEGAPEVEKKLRHSLIKADRWSCGCVLLFPTRHVQEGRQTIDGICGEPEGV